MNSYLIIHYDNNYYLISRSIGHTCHDTPARRLFCAVYIVVREPRPRKNMIFAKPPQLKLSNCVWLLKCSSFGADFRPGGTSAAFMGIIINIINIATALQY